MAGVGVTRHWPRAARNDAGDPMALIIASYVIALLVFALLDIIWLSIMGPALYKPVLGDILAPEVRMGPAAAFYLMYPVGLVVFAILPAIKSDQLSSALMLGALLGAITYATYDLTNFATLRNWTLQLTVLDIVYGALMGAAVSAAGYLAAPPVAAWLGGKV
jgi:uncharacterized membrane protein